MDKFVVMQMILREELRDRLDAEKLHIIPMRNDANLLLQLAHRCLFYLFACRDMAADRHVPTAGKRLLLLGTFLQIDTVTVVEPDMDDMMPQPLFVNNIFRHVHSNRFALCIEDVNQFMFW